MVSFKNKVIVALKKHQKKHESSNDHLIREILKDPLYKFNKDGQAWTKLTVNGQGISDDWREIGYKKADGYVRIRYKDEFLFLQRVIFQKYCGDLKKNMTINHINLDHADNSSKNLEQVTQNENNQKKHKHYKKSDLIKKVISKLKTV